MQCDVNVIQFTVAASGKGGWVAGSQLGAPAVSLLGHVACLLLIEVGHACGSQLSVILGNSRCIVLGKINRPTQSGVSHS